MLNWQKINENRKQIPARMKTTGHPLLSNVPAARLRGNVISSASWASGGEKKYGLYDFTAMANPVLTPFKTSEYLNANGGGAYYDGKLHYINFEDTWGAIFTYYYEVDMTTGEMSSGESIYNLGLLATDIDYDPVEQRVVGCFMNEDLETYALAEVNYETKTKRIVKQLDEPYMAVAFNGSGELYAINLSGNLLKIDKTNGEETLVGFTGIRLYDTYQSAAFDRQTGTLYWAAVPENGETGIYTVDLTTGKANLIDNFPDNEQVVCLTVLPPQPAKDAPAAISDFKADFGTVGSNDGMISFTLPVRTVDDKPLAGTLSWKVNVNGETLLTGTGQPGQSVNKPVRLSTGNKLFTVSTSNAVGTSAETSMNTYVGYDTPITPANVQLTYMAADKKVKLSWDASTIGSHNGYVDKNQLTYSIVRYPAGDTLAVKLKETTAIIDAPTGAQQITNYGVIAVNGTAQSYPGISNSMMLGDGLPVPYEETFDDASSFNGFTVVNTNNDDKMWQYFEEENSAICPASIWEDNNDWLITPFIHLDSHYAYTLSFDVKASMYSYPPEFDVAMGMAEDKLTTSLIPTTTVTWSSYKKASSVIKVSDTGDYLFGIHCTTKVNQFHLLVDNIKVEVLANIEAPDSITNLTVKNHNDGKAKAEITFKAPRLRLNGSALSGLSGIEVWRDDVKVKTFENPVPGETLSWVDEPETSGTYTYTFKPFNEAGEGLNHQITTMVGEDLPLTPPNVVLKRHGSDLVLTWDNPGKKGKNGGFVNADQLKYNIYDVNEMGYLVTPAMGTVSETSYTIPNVDQTGAMRTKSYVVTAVNQAGESGFGISSEIVLGDPIEAPLSESFANGNLHSFWYSTGSSNTVFFPTTIRSQDNDGGCMAFSANEVGDEAVLKSGRISLAKVDAPYFAMSYYAYPGKQMLLSIEIYGEDDDLLTTESIDYATMTGEEGWMTATIDLSAFKEQKFIRIFIRAKNQDTEKTTFIDNLRVDGGKTQGIDMLFGNDSPVNVYSIDGVLVRSNATSLQGLPKGVYIAGDKKVVVR
ncbi:MAG: choice-of-anchor J domain-containing protein [Prevotellaceae bacterium]|nr:choice-of-anchor J domain-containing protein [Prevotellaceae bacterium]